VLESAVQPQRRPVLEVLALQVVGIKLHAEAANWIRGKAHGRTHERISIKTSQTRVSRVTHELTQCESPSQAKKRYDDHCKFCELEVRHSDEELEFTEMPCVECGIIHLEKNMFDKIKGHLCRSCCVKYERELMKTIRLKGNQ
jgi:hypothetical protein